MASRMQLVAYNVLRFVSPDGMECTYKFPHPDDDDYDKNRDMQLVRVCAHSQWDPSSFEAKHALLDKSESPLSETLERLQRLAAELKVFRASLPPSGSLESGDYSPVSAQLYSKIFSVEYSDMTSASGAAGGVAAGRTKLRL